LLKVHSQRHKTLPGYENGIRRELDTCTSSDALLMNVFCYPGVFKNVTTHPLSLASLGMNGGARLSDLGDFLRDSPSLSAVLGRLDDRLRTAPSPAVLWPIAILGKWQV
jgi:hypothetical protein